MSFAQPGTDVQLLTRARAGRRLGGVCAGVAPPRALKVGWLRTAFGLGTLVFGLGAVVYAALWLILPLDGEDPAAGESRRGVVVFAQACAGCAGLAALGLLGAVATIFGFGWAVLGLAALVLIFGLGAWTRTGPVWVLLPLTALTLPSVGVAAAGWRLAPQTAQTVIAPGKLTSATYRSGLGLLMIDLRRTQLPASGTVSLRIRAGIRRTIVALPHDRCVRLDLSYHVDPYLARAATVISGRFVQSISSLSVFGTTRISLTADHVRTGGPASDGPLLKLDFSSMGGGLVVRDWPVGVDPETNPNWPGYPVTVEPRPDTTGMKRGAARQLVASWKPRARVERQQAAVINALMPGPCGWQGSGG